MKTPISYYGGKLNLVSEILPMIPPHTQYVEPFCGGAAVYWCKDRSAHEVINDIDDRVYNFWNVCKTDFAGLENLVKNTMHHEKEHTDADKILRAGNLNPLQYAWAFWVQTNMSFSHKVNGGFAFASDLRTVRTTKSKRADFTGKIYERLQMTEIFNRDALELIKLKDGPETFFYFDPPYPEGDCGHYGKHKGAYYELLAALEGLQAKWLLSSYPSPELEALRLKNGWETRDIKKNMSVSGKDNAGKSKTECLTWNYSYNGRKLSLF